MGDQSSHVTDNDTPARLRDIDRSHAEAPAAALAADRQAADG
jgi:hypothetical protein